MSAEPAKTREVPHRHPAVAALKEGKGVECMGDANNSMTSYRDTSVVASDSDSDDSFEESDPEDNSPEPTLPVKKTGKYRDKFLVQRSDSECDSTSESDDVDQEERDVPPVADIQNSFSLDSSESDVEPSCDKVGRGSKQKFTDTKRDSSSISDSDEDEDIFVPVNRLSLPKCSAAFKKTTYVFSDSDTDDSNGAVAPKVGAGADHADNGSDSSSSPDSDSDEEIAAPKLGGSKKKYVHSDSDSDEAVTVAAFNHPARPAAEASSSDTDDDDCMIVGVEKNSSTSRKSKPLFGDVRTKLAVASNQRQASSSDSSTTSTSESGSSAGVGKNLSKPLSGDVRTKLAVASNQRQASSSDSSTTSTSGAESSVSGASRVIRIVQSGSSGANSGSGGQMTKTIVVKAPQTGAGHPAPAANVVKQVSGSGHTASATSILKSASGSGHAASATSALKPVSGSGHTTATSVLKPVSGSGHTAATSVLKPGHSVQTSSMVKPTSGPSQQQGQVKVIHVSGEASRELMKNMNDKTELSRRLEQQKRVLTSVNVKSLPDGGQKLKQLIADMTSQMAGLEIKIQKGQEQLAQQAGLGPGQKITVQPQRHTVAGQGLPPGARQTKMTDHTMPSHVYQQMFAAKPQAMTLYGGRMTAARLQQVGDVTSEAIERIHKQLETCPSPEEEVEDPKGLRLKLMTHQRQALAWLSWREKQQPPGGILADDMGLGKTLTMISLILMCKLNRHLDKDKEVSKKWLSKQLGSSLTKSNATLVVCPASLVHQWDKEIERRCRRNKLDVVVYHGANRERDQQVLADADVVLTTYNIISKEVGIPEEMKKNKKAQEMAVSDKLEEDIPVSQQPMLMQIAWERIILDEAHCIKNNKSLTAMSTCRLRALYRWALTGTPIQNDLVDMYSLLRFLRCSPFDEFKVWKRQVDNKSANGTRRLNTLVKSLLLRRTKDQVDKQGKPLVALPPKTIVTHDLELCADERKVYEKIFNQSKATLQQYLDRHEEKERVKQGLAPLNPQPSGDHGNNPWSKQDARPGFTPASQLTGSSLANQSSQDRMAGLPPPNQKPVGAGQMLLHLLRLRQCCSHLSLMKDALDVEGLETDGVELDIVQQMQGLMLQEERDPSEPAAEAKKTSPMFETAAPSAKIQELLKLIRDVRDQSPKGAPMKSVVVSQWTKMLEVAQHHLIKEGLRCCTIKGDVPAKKRMELVDAFNTDPKGPEVMLLSLRAGGVGLNLIGGNNLFLIDMHWNPALEQQACDRIYRVGQTKDVSIHRFICKDTVEEKILELQKKKLSLASNVLTGAGASSNKLTLADLRMLFGLDHDAKKTAGLQQAAALQRPLY